LRLGAKERGADIYPSYHRVQAYKENLHPPNNLLQISDIKAKYPLQAILDHTVSRIVEMHEEVLCSILEMDPLRQFTCYFSWGFDGSTGQSNYKQKYDKGYFGLHSDSSLMATTMIPLIIVQGESLKSHVLWMNTVPQSVRFNRPIELHFVKETKDVIIEKRDSMKKEIDQLAPYTLKKNNADIIFNYNLQMTIIDGKVFNIIKGINSMTLSDTCTFSSSLFSRVLCRIE